MAQGDEASFTQLYKKYYASIFLYARLVTSGDSAMAEDATAEAFIALWKGQYSFDTTGHFIAFLRTVAHNKCIDGLRAAQRSETVGRELQYLDAAGQEQLFYREVFLQAGILSRIREEVDRLPARTGEVFRLAYYEQLKNAEIAHRLGITDSSVRRRKTEALHQLRGVLKGADWELLLLLTVSQAVDFCSF